MSTHMKKLSFCLAILSASLISFSASAVLAATWDNGGVGNDWSTGDNWNPNGVPSGAGVQARIGGGFTVDVTSVNPSFTGDFVTGDSAGTTNLNISGSGLLTHASNHFAANNGSSIVNMNITSGGAYSQTGGNFDISNGRYFLTIDGSSSFSTVGELKTNNSSRLYIDISSGASFSADHLWTRYSNTNQVTDIFGMGTLTLGGNGGDAFRNGGRVEAIGGLLNFAYGYTQMGNYNGSFSETMGDGQIAGYYATSGGSLHLPSMILGGGNVHSWGNRHDASADQIPLIGSLQLTGSGMQGTVDVNLLALDHGSVMAGLVNPIGVWEMSETIATGFVTGITLHYDDFLASSLTIDENDLKVFYNDGSGWTDITSSINTGTDLIKGTASSFNGQFAVATDAVVPEPSSFVLAGLGLLGLAGFGLRRRQK